MNQEETQYDRARKAVDKARNFRMQGDSRPASAYGQMVTQSATLAVAEATLAVADAVLLMVDELRARFPIQ